jgi:hypothetical protein
MILVYLTFLPYYVYYIRINYIFFYLCLMQGQKEEMHSVVHVHKLLDQFSCGNDYALKVLLHSYFYVIEISYKL